MSLKYANQFVTTYLNVGGGIDDSQTTGIVLQSTNGIDTTVASVACVTWSDPLNTTNAEFITYESINSTTNTLQGVTRGAEGYSAKSHSNGATIAFPISKSHINEPNDLLRGVSVFENDIDFASGYNIKYNSADPWRTISLPAASWSPTTTSGCAAITTVEAGTNDIDYQVLDFDASSDEKAFINFQMPDSWDAGTIQFRYVWTNAGGGSAETVDFALSGRSFADNDAIDQANGTSVTVTDTWIAQGDVHISDWSGNVTLAGTPAAGEWVHLEIFRDVSEDNLTGDARLISVQIRYKQAQFGD